MSPLGFDLSGPAHRKVAHNETFGIQSGNSPIVKVFRCGPQRNVCRWHWRPVLTNGRRRKPRGAGRDLWRKRAAASDAWVKGRTPARRWGKPEELVGTAIFLASAASDYVSGQIIYVDGGMISVL
jgi:NAD(P)-dependent dehydrogenase (short-subunit alcohol dehydrogenase family)